VDQNSVRRDLLARAYANNQGSCVAFIDESYHAPGFAFRAAGGPFYIMAAYVVPVDDLEAMRGDVEAVVGGTYWHSTESHMTDEGQEAIRGFTGYIGEGREPVIVTLRRPIEESDTDGEIARAACLRALLEVLAGGLHCDPISLAIFEERKFATQKNADEMTIKGARSDGIIPRHMHVMPASPSFERLLWLPDVASFALYQHHAGVRSDYALPFHARVIEIRA
jgi:hypothetical protein